VHEKMGGRIDTEDYARFVHDAKKKVAGNKKFERHYFWAPFTISTIRSE